MMKKSILKNGKLLTKLEQQRINGGYDYPQCRDADDCEAPYGFPLTMGMCQRLVCYRIIPSGE